MLKVAAIGECMLELSNPGAKPLERNMNVKFSYGGDTLNTAIYLARLDVDCAYLTALGDDPYSHWLLSEWEKERLDTSMVLQIPERNPGLYMIQTDADGERSFHYWRKNSPARELFSTADRVARIYSQLEQYDLIYFSGITLSLYDDDSLDRFFSVLHRLRDNGKRIGFDGNFRAAGWSTIDKARTVFERAYAATDIMLPTYDDEAVLFGDDTPSETVKRLSTYGINEIAVKDGAKGVLVYQGDKEHWVSTIRVDKMVDSTAAGDSFNAGYLAARVRGASPAEAAACGNKLAGTVIQHSGAIISQSSMPQLYFRK